MRFVILSVVHLLLDLALLNFHLLLFLIVNSAWQGLTLWVAYIHCTLSLMTSWESSCWGNIYSWFLLIRFDLWRAACCIHYGSILIYLHIRRDLWEAMANIVMANGGRVLENWLLRQIWNVLDVLAALRVVHVGLFHLKLLFILLAWRNTHRV